MVSLVCALVGEERREFFVDIDANEMVDSLKNAIKTQNGDIIPCAARGLQLYCAMQDCKWFSIEDLDDFNLDSLAQMTAMDPFRPINEYFGRDFHLGYRQIHVFVVARSPSLAGLSIFSEPDFDTLREECIHLPDWEAGVVYNISRILKFMQLIGGYTSFGKILWRLEGKQVLSIILEKRRLASADESSLADMRLRSVVTGSPGSGKINDSCSNGSLYIFQIQDKCFVLSPSGRSGCEKLFNISGIRGWKSCTLCKE